mgnify:CR=1 FL=1
MYQDGPLALDPVSKILFMTRSSNTVNRNQKIQLDLLVKLEVEKQQQ